MRNHVNLIHPPQLCAGLPHRLALGAEPHEQRAHPAAAGLLLGDPKPRNPRPLDTIEGGRVYKALRVESKSVLDALCRVKKCLRRTMQSQKVS